MIVGLNTLVNQYVPSFYIKNIIHGQYLVYDSVRRAFVNSGSIPIADISAENIIGGTAGYVLTSAGSASAIWQPPMNGYYEEVIATAGNIVDVVAVRLQGNTLGKAFMQVFVNGLLQIEGPSRAYEVTNNTRLTFNTPFVGGESIVLFSQFTQSLITEIPEGNLLLDDSSTLLDSDFIILP